MNKLRFAAIASGALGFAVSARPERTEHTIPWEVISVEPGPASGCKDGEGGIRFRSNGLSAACAPTVFLVEFAYRLMDPTRIVRLPKWAAGSQTYKIEARVSKEDAAALADLTRDQKATMMQSILAERFGLKAHIESRTLPAYALVVAKSGTKLTASVATTPGASQFGQSNGEVKWVNSPLTNLRFLLAEETGRPVVDNTGLTGKYDFTLQYTPAAQATADGSGRPTIFSALQEQLGLKLVPIKQPVEVLVIDALELPTPN